VLIAIGLTLITASVGFGLMVGELLIKFAKGMVATLTDIVEVTVVRPVTDLRDVRRPPTQVRRQTHSRGRSDRLSDAFGIKLCCDAVVSAHHPPGNYGLL